MKDKQDFLKTKCTFITEPSSTHTAQGHGNREIPLVSVPTDAEGQEGSENGAECELQMGLQLWHAV